MQLQVIRNLELSIRSIHIVYEDKSTKPNWEPTILKEDTPLIHKVKRKNKSKIENKNISGVLFFSLVN
jgi:hypothetical protein